MSLVRLHFIELNDDVCDGRRSRRFRPIAASLEARSHVQSIDVARPSAHRADDRRVGACREQCRSASYAKAMCAKVSGVLADHYHEFLNYPVDCFFRDAAGL